MECSLQFFFDSPHVDLFFGGADFLIVFFLKCDGFNNGFLMFLNVFLRVEDTILEPILEPKNGIAAKNFGSKTPLVDSILETIFGF